MGITVLIILLNFFSSSDFQVHNKRLHRGDQLHGSGDLQRCHGRIDSQHGRTGHEQHTEGQSGGSRGDQSEGPISCAASTSGGGRWRSTRSLPGPN